MKLNKKSILKKIAIIVGIFFLLIISLFLFTSPPPNIELERGLVTYNLQFEDTVGHHQLTGRVWSLPNADKNKPKGIILISHGFSSRSEAMVLYASELARAGFLVAGVTHDDISLLKNGDVVNDPMIARQRHLNLLLSEIYKTAENPDIKTIPVGFLGYSLGGFSVLNASGAKADFSRQDKYCQSDFGKKNIIMCNSKFTERMRVIQDNQNIEQKQLQKDVKAIAVLAPAYTSLIENTSSDIPALMIYGELDEYVNSDEIESFTQNSSIISQKKKLDNAGHYVYLPACSFPQFGEHCDDPKQIYRVKTQQEVVSELVIFFNEEMNK